MLRRRRDSRAGSSEKERMKARPSIARWWAITAHQRPSSRASSTRVTHQLTSPPSSSVRARQHLRPRVVKAPGRLCVPGEGFGLGRRHTIQRRSNDAARHEWWDGHRARASRSERGPGGIRHAGRRVVRPVQALGLEPRPYGAVRLRGTDFRRIRMGQLRVVYLIDETERRVVIVRVARRSESTYRGLHDE